MSFRWTRSGSVRSGGPRSRPRRESAPTSAQSPARSGGPEAPEVAPEARAATGARRPRLLHRTRPWRRRTQGRPPLPRPSFATGRPNASMTTEGHVTAPANSRGGPVSPPPPPPTDRPQDRAGEREALRAGGSSGRACAACEAEPARERVAHSERSAAAVGVSTDRPRAAGGAGRPALGTREGPSAARAGPAGGRRVCFPCARGDHGQGQERRRRPRDGEPSGGSSDARRAPARGRPSGDSRAASEPANRSRPAGGQGAPGPASPSSQGLGERAQGFTADENPR
jgi:hypothetical protein